MRYSGDLFLPVRGKGVRSPWNDGELKIDGLFRVVERVEFHRGKVSTGAFTICTREVEALMMPFQFQLAG